MDGADPGRKAAREAMDRIGRAKSRRPEAAGREHDRPSPSTIARRVVARHTERRRRDAAPQPPAGWPLDAWYHVAGWLPPTERVRLLCTCRAFAPMRRDAQRAAGTCICLANDSARELLPTTLLHEPICRRYMASNGRWHPSDCVDAVSFREAQRRAREGLYNVVL